jgi:hypothetical protein
MVLGTYIHIKHTQIHVIALPLSHDFDIASRPRILILPLCADIETARIVSPRHELVIHNASPQLHRFAALFLSSSSRLESAALLC